MIKSNELRLGNWVISNGVEESRLPIHVQMKDIDQNLCKAGEHLKDYDYIFPIPLSPEVLQKCGFHKFNHAWVREGYEHKFYSAWWFTIWNEEEGEYNYNSAEFHPILKSLHQLQNLYFALTQEELIYTP